MPPGPATPSSTQAADLRVLSGRYRLDAVLGHGGVGVVWKARDLQLDRDVAVKQLQPGLARDRVAAQRFRREATTAASLVHSSMVTIFDVGEDQGVPYLVMELVDGPPLADVLRAHGALGVDEAVAIGHRVSSALAVAHDRGLVHRDVKPANVLLSRDGSPRLVDFGTVHVRGETSVELTMPGTMLGTIGYVAPEQLEGETADARSDVFSLGLVLYECLVGAPAFAPGPVAEMARRRLADDVPPPSRHRTGLPTDLDDLVRAATRRDREERPRDAKALADALAPFVADDADRLVAALAGGTAPVPQTEVASPATSGQPSSAGGHTSVMPTAATAGEAPHTTTMSQPDRDATTAPPTPDTGRGEAADGPSSRRSLFPVLGLLAVALGAVIAMAVLNLGSGGRQIDAEATGDPEGGAARAVASASDFDPLSDSAEHPEDIALAHDDDPSTAWKTEGYNSPDLGGLKSGVGMWVQADGAIAHAEIDLAVPGTSVELYALDEEPDGDPSSWGEPAQTWQDAEGTLSAEVSGGPQYLLVWFTEMGPDGGRFRGGISEIRVS